MLGLGLVQYKRQAGMPGPSGTPGVGRFLLPYSECDYTLESIIDDLQVMHVQHTSSACLCQPCVLPTAHVQCSLSMSLSSLSLQSVCVMCD